MGHSLMRVPHWFTQKGLPEMRKTLYANSLAVPAVTFTGAKVTGAVTGGSIDRYQTSGTRGNYHGGVLFIISSGTITDGTTTATIEDSDAGSVWTAAAAADIQGSAVFLLTDDDTVKEISYDGSKRFCRLILTTTGGATGGVIGAIALLTGAAVQR